MFRVHVHPYSEVLLPLISGTQDSSPLSSTIQASILNAHVVQDREFLFT